MLVRISQDEPPIAGRSRFVGYVADQTHPDVWHVESAYQGVLPRTMMGAELEVHDLTTPWPAR